MPNFFGTETASGSITNGVGVNTLFFGSSSAGTAAITTNSGGNTAFYETSKGGSATLTTNSGGNTYFFGSSTAEAATLTTNGGATLRFELTSRAGTATLLNTGGNTYFFGSSTAEGAGITNTNGGGTAFQDASTAGAARIANASNGVTGFDGSARAGTATITNASGGGTLFSATSTAESAQITTNSGGVTVFSGSSTSADATVTTNTGGETAFDGSSKGGSAAIITNAGGKTFFRGSSSAETATLTTNSGGTLAFEAASRAGTATLLNDGGVANFSGTGTAENAGITNTNGGGTAFHGASTAGSAQITNKLGGVTVFRDGAGAESAAITNESGGGTLFTGTSTAGNATITTNSGGATAFRDTSSAGTASASLTTNSGGDTRFYNASTAGHATLTTASGGHTYFLDASTAGSARLIAAQGGEVDFSPTSGPNSDHRIGAGSIEGGGTYHLGSNALTVGSLHTSTVVSGSIRDGGVAGGSGASLVKVGTGTLTLSGTSSYTGGTILSQGMLVLDSAQAAGTGAITFTSGSQTLQLTLGALGAPGGIYGNTLADLGLGDILDLRGLAYAADATAVYGGGTLTVTSGGASESFVLGGSYAGLSFRAVSGGAGGVAVQVVDAAPTVSGVTAGTADGTYKAGDVISVRLTMSEAVTVTGTPQLTLETGTTDRVLDFAGVTGGNVLTFTYTVQPGDTAADLDYRDTAALKLNGGTIKDGAGNDAILTLATPGQIGSISHDKALVIDTTAPVVTAVQVPASGTYKIGDVLTFTVGFSEAVTLTGADSTLGLTIGSASVQATYLSKTATSVTYGYTVQEGRVDPDGIAVGGLDLKNSTLTDAAGHAAAVALNGVGTTETVLVDAVRPTVTSILRQVPAAGTTNEDVLVYRVTFSEDVSGVGTGDFAVAGTSATVTAVTPTGGNAYDVTVAGGDLASLNGSVTLSFAPGYTITDTAGNALASTAPTGTNDASTLVDNTAPTAAVALSDTALKAGETATVTLTFSEVPTGFTVDNVTAEGGSLSMFAATGDPKVYTATFTPAADLDDVSNALTVGAAWTDAAGNAPAGTTSSGTYAIDTTLPVATIALAQTRFTPGQSTSVTFTFSEAPLGFTLEDVTAENGTLSGLAVTADPRVFTATLTPATGVLHPTNRIALDTTWSDAAGNAPAARVSSADYTLDTRIAAAPSAPDLVDASDLGTSSTDNVTSDTTPTFSGAGANAGAPVRLYADTVLVGTGMADASGQWSITASELAAGNYTAVARQVDAAGTEGPASVGLAVTIASQVGNVVLEPSTETNENGQTIEVITIPVVTGGGTSAGTAAVPLVASGGQVLLSVEVPAGFGLRVETTGTSSADALIQAIRSRTEAGTQEQQTLTEAGAAFLAGLVPGTTLTVRTIVPTVPGPAAPSQPLVIRGQPGPSGQQEAVVIDVSGLPPGTVIQLEGVEFAVVTGAVTITGGSGAQVLFADGASQRIVLGADDDELHGGGGDDVIGSLGGNDRLFGDEGHDIVTGGEGQDQLSGGSGNDRIAGREGDDQLWGGAGRDRLWGGTGTDALSGDAGRDHLWGGDGNDRLLGQDGHDRLWGGRGDDHLEGGAGRDVLVGGKGADTFVFQRVADDAAGRLRDAIRDFRSGEDKIDLSGIDPDAARGGNQSFSWVDGTDLDATFTGEAGELRFKRGMVMGDLDGDGQADFRINVQGSLTAQDIIL